MIRQKKHTLSKDAEQVLSNLSSLPSFYQLYEVTKHEDMEFDSFELMEKLMKIVLFYMKTYMKWIIVQKFVVMQQKVSIKH